MHKLDRVKSQVLDRVDLVEVVGEHLSLKRRGKRWVGLCPFHAEKTPSFTVSPDLGIFKCFGCGVGGDVFSFVQKRENVSFVEALRMLADRAGVAWESGSADGAKAGNRTELARVNAWAVKFFRSQLTEGQVGASCREYLEGRKVSKDTAGVFGIGLSVGEGRTLQAAAARAGFGPDLLVAADLLRQGEDGHTYDTFRHRLMFPIRDATARVIGFGGRTLVEDRAKYLNTRQNALFDKGKCLYGIDLARKRIGDAGRAIVVEGYTDCIAAHQAGFAETVATLGTALTESHVHLLRRYCDHAVLLFDSDEAGAAAADRAIRVALPRHLTVTLARVPLGKDPCEFLEHESSEAFSDMLNQAVDALAFQWDLALGRFEGSGSGAGRREALLDFLSLVAEACQTNAVDAIQRGLIANQVAGLVKLPVGEVHRLMSDLEHRIARRVPRGASVGSDGPGDSGPEPPARQPDPAGAAESASIRIVEILLNEPGVCGGDVEELKTTLVLPGPLDRQAADLVLQMTVELGEFRLADVLGRCVDPALAQRVTELAQIGADRGNYQAGFDDERARLAAARRSRAIDECMHGPGELAPAEAGFEEARRRLEAISQPLGAHRHFGPRRMIRDAAEGANLD